MVRLLEEVQRSAGAQAVHDALEQIELRQLVTRALKETHRDVDLLKVRGAIGARLSCRMQREGQKDQSADPRQRDLCLRLRGHPAAERSAAGEERQIRCEPRSLHHGGANRRLAKGGRVRPPAPALHVGELITQRGYATLRQAVCDGLQRRMLHSRTRSVGQNEHGPGRVRPVEQAGHPLICADLDRQALIPLSRHTHQPTQRIAVTPGKGTPVRLESTRKKQMA